MSVGNDTIIFMYACYKCKGALGYNPEDTVHPLCASCQDDFDDWFRNQLGR